VAGRDGDDRATESLVTPRLIVVRGPSGPGKSTVARCLFERAGRRVCLIEQDHYRFIFRPAGGGTLPNSATIHRMIEQNVTTAPTDGCDVVLEGILSRRSYGLVLDRLFSAGVSENFLYSFDVSIEETLRRHRTLITQDAFPMGVAETDASP
jgi:2-phosphoglycerate kinase